MFGHLKAEELMDLIEGGEIPLTSRSHLQKCAQCSEALSSARSLHAEMAKSAAGDNEIPEPDWFQFRADVRNTMLSRAARRQAKTNTWSGWLLRPAMTWGLAVAFTAGLSVGLVIWKYPGTVTPSQTTAIETSAVPGTDQVYDGSVDSAAMDSGLTTWSQASVFDELSQLSDAQAEKLQQLLEADAQPDPVKQ
ncbi:MAG TPA: hypothetical protein VK210_14310 [Terriglobia bacterium]|nr:hypothetical protein [Terriglobia bacterium]